MAYIFGPSPYIFSFFTTNNNGYVLKIYELFILFFFFLFTFFLPSLCSKCSLCIFYIYIKMGQITIFPWIVKSVIRIFLLRP